MDREIKRKRSVPVKSNKKRYLTAKQRSVRNKVYDEYEKIENPNARKWFDAVPYQLVYLARLRQAEQDTNKKDERGV